MLPRKSPTALLLVLIVSLTGLVSGCGGGGESGGDSGGGNGGGGQAGQQQGEPQNEPRESRIGVGNVVSVDAERRRMVVQPSQEAESAEKLTVNVRKNAEIRLGDQEAEMGDVAEGQQAQVNYVTKNDVNRATSVQLFEATGDQPSGGGGTSN